MRGVALVLGMVAAIFGIVSGLWQLQDRCAGRPLVGCIHQRFFGHTEECVPGSVVAPTADTFHLKILAVQDNESLQELLKRAREEKNSQVAQAILAAVENGKIAPITEDARAILQIHGITSDLPPTQIPFLAGQSICQKMVMLARTPDGTLFTAIELRGGKYRGEAAIVLPRALLYGSPEARFCVEPTFRLANPTDGRKKVYCDSPGASGLYDTATRGLFMRTTILIRKKDGS